MATRRFCDLCNGPITDEDDKPFIRVLEFLTPGQPYPVDHPKNKATAHVMIVNEGNHVLPDVCNVCKLKVVNEGIPTDSVSSPNRVATLQPPPPPPPPQTFPFEPSIPT